MRKGLCFKCEKPGHRANDPEFHQQPQRGGYIPLRRPIETPKPKMKGKELTAHVRKLLAEMDDGDKEDFFNEAGNEGF